jgi:hypothetical protein
MTAVARFLISPAIFCPFAPDCVTGNGIGSFLSGSVRPEQTLQEPPWKRRNRSGKRQTRERTLDALL